MLEDLISIHLAGVRCEQILDVGPGYAEFSRLSARTTGAHHITFIDCDEGVLSWQEQRCKEVAIDSTSHKLFLDSASIASIRDRFDLIHCQEVLEHIPSPEQTLRALAGLLVPGGRIIITVPTRRSEVFLTWLNPSYMLNEPHGHVNQFDERALRALVTNAGLSILAFHQAQPQYFIAHSWLVGTRMRLDGSTGEVLSSGFRTFVFGNLVKYAHLFFRLTGESWWSKLLPRNYFVVARSNANPR